MPRAGLENSRREQRKVTCTRVTLAPTISKVISGRFGILHACTCAEVHSTTETAVGLPSPIAVSPYQRCMATSEQAVIRREQHKRQTMLPRTRDVRQGSIFQSMSVHVCLSTLRSLRSTMLASCCWPAQSYNSTCADGEAFSGQWKSSLDPLRHPVG